MTDATAGIGTATAAQANSSLLAGQQNLGTSYTTFLTLLTTQLKNQDPTSPLDTNQFTQQLVQMTGVQQQLLSNELLQTLVNNSNGGGGVSGAVGLIGKTVATTSPSATLSGGAANWDYTLGTAAASSSATIKDANGVVVWTGSLSDLSAGQHTFTWNGKSLSGVAEPNADYTLSIAAKTDGGQDVAASVVQTGVVSSVASDANGVELTLQGRGKAPLTSVTSVTNG